MSNIFLSLNNMKIRYNINIYKKRDLRQTQNDQYKRWLVEYKTNINPASSIFKRVATQS